MIEISRDFKDIASDFRLAVASLNTLLYQLEKVNGASEDSLDLTTMGQLYSCRDRALACYNDLSQIIYNLEHPKPRKSHVR